MADEDDPDRDAILRRRRRFVAVALGALATQGACADDSVRPPPDACLSVRLDAQSCLGADAGPPPMDSGSDAGAPGDGGYDAAVDGGRDATVIGLDGSVPTPCLSMMP